MNALLMLALVRAIAGWVGWEKRRAAVQSQSDLCRGTVVLGATGSGKTSLAISRAAAAALSGRPVLWVGTSPADTAKLRRLLLRSGVDADRIFVWNPRERNCPPVNMLLQEQGTAAEMERLADQLEHMMESMADSWGHLMADAFRNAALAVLEWGWTLREVTVRDASRLMTDEAFREDVIRGIRTDDLREFWEGWDPKKNAPAIGRIRRMLTNQTLARLLGSPGDFSLAEAVAGGKAVLVDLDIKDSPTTDRLLAQVWTHEVLRAAARRTERDPVWHVYLDEWALYASRTVPVLLEQYRKNAVALTLIGQGTWQLPGENLRRTIMQAGTHYCFRMEPEDAKHLAWFMGVEAEDLVNLPERTCYVTALTRGVRLKARRRRVPDAYPKGQRHSEKPAAVRPHDHNPDSPRALPPGDKRALPQGAGPALSARRSAARKASGDG